MIKNQQGIVALLSVILVSILLMVIALSTTILMNGELKQAADYDNGVKAYYAVEAGIEDALLKIKTTPGTDQPTCTDSGTSLDLAGAVKYTCQLITRNTNTVSQSLNPEEAVQVDTGGKIFQTVVLRWNSLGGSLEAGQTGNCPPNINDWSTGAAWKNTNKWPGPLELTTINYAGTVDAASSPAPYTLVLRPNSVGIQGTPKAFNDTASPPVDVKCISGIYDNVTKSTAGGYQYVLIISGFSGSSTNNYILRLRPRYVGTDFRMEFYNCASPLQPAPSGVTTGWNFPPDSTCPRVQVADQTITIDVTAKAGSIFRRGIVKVPITAGVARGLDFSLFSQTDICKNFSINPISGAAEDGACPVP